MRSVSYQPFKFFYSGLEKLDTSVLFVQQSQRCLTVSGQLHLIAILERLMHITINRCGAWQRNIDTRSAVNPTGSPQLLFHPSQLLQASTSVSFIHHEQR